MNKAAKIFIYFDLFLINLVVGFLFFQYSLEPYFFGKNNIQNQESESVSTQQGQFVCDDDCLELIDQKIQNALFAKKDFSTTATPTPVPSITSVIAKTKSASYVSIPGSGQTLSTDWTGLDSTAFYLSNNDYPGIIEAYFEVNMKLVNGNGFGYARLFDVTHGVSVAGSEVSVSSQVISTVSSGKISFYSGNNLYKVQVKSLTADTTVFESGRVKIITLK